MNKYDADYFLHGKEKGLSLYENYRWLPELTPPMAKRMVEHLGIQKGDKILDFGCARGFLVRALVESGYDAWGADCSTWAISNCDEKVKGRLTLTQKPLINYDWIICKDTLEHLNVWDLLATLAEFALRTKKGALIVVPLSYHLGEPYVIEDYEKDITHVVRWPLWRWVQECHIAFDETWEISSRYRIEGIKDNYAKWPTGNGFITIRKLATLPSPQD